ncbi:MAG: argininosuccinate lyase [Microthrixaceae bacterium]
MHGAEQGRGQLWHGRFASGPAGELMEFTESLSYDQRLIFSDIACSKAHVRGLHRGGLLGEEEMGLILGGLDSVELEYRDGSFVFVESDEDIHTAIERRVTELVGPVGGKLHTGRSRNDQVATAFRHLLKGELEVISVRLLELVETLVARVDEVGTGQDAPYLPGYTHLQQAQPVLLAHHLMAHCWALLRDLDRVAQCSVRVDVSPLGAGALAGSSLDLDPDFTAAEAGFGARFENSLDATSDRDFVAEGLFVLAMVGLHLSRMGEEVVLWSSAEFGFISLDDGYATGSSMLPQKKNPDIAELARGKAGRLIGDLTGFLATMKSLPLAYNRDLQEDKEPLFDALDNVRLALGAMSGMYRTLTFDTAAMARSADNPYGAATDLAELLVSRGTPFREAHAIVGELVRRSIDDGVPFVELVSADERLGSDGAALVAPGASVRNRRTPGSAGPDAVTLQRVRLGEAVDAAAARL